MEHINVEELANGYKRLTPDEGYILYNRRTKQRYSQAVTKKSEQFMAVEV